MKARQLFLAYLLLSVSAVPTCLASSIVLQWDPNTESDLVGYKVYYKANSSQLPFDGAGAIEGVAPIDVAKQTTATVTGLDPSVDYYFAVTAYNAAGMESQYSNIITIAKVADVTAPTVSLTSPAAAATVKGVVGITATATDDIGVTKVEFYDNNTLLAASNVAPYSYNWDTSAIANGSHTLLLKAYDAAGNVGQSANVTVNVLNVLSDTTAPTVSITAPTGGTAGGSVLISANATDNVAVSKVEFYINGVLRGTSASAPYRYTWNTSSFSNGAYTLSAKAYDAAGNVGQSANVSVNVLNDTTAPSVTFLSPTKTTVTTSNVKVSASATDNVAVARMELYVDGALKSSTTSSSLSLQVSLRRGMHTVTVKAFDSSNNVATKSMTINRIY